MHRPQLRTSSPVSPHFSFRNPALHRLQSHTSHPLRPHVMAHAVWRFSTSSTLRGGIIWRRYFLFSSSLFFSSLARARGGRCGNSLRDCLLSRFLPLFGLLADCEPASSRLQVRPESPRKLRTLPQQWQEELPPENPRPLLQAGLLLRQPALSLRASALYLRQPSSYPSSPPLLPLLPR